MTVKELNVGDVFRVAGEPELWRKQTLTQAYRVQPEAPYWGRHRPLAQFKGKAIEVVERADTAPVRRMGNTLVLRDGEVLLQFLAAVAVYRFLPGEAFTEFVLTGSSFSASHAEAGASDAALLFSITAGSKHLNRPGNSDLIAHRGRLYGRATKKEVLGESKAGGYKRVTKIDGAARLTIAGVLTLPEEPALYDIIQEPFGAAGSQASSA